MRKYTFIYTDKANYKREFTFDHPQLIHPQDRMPIEDLGITIEQFFDDVMQTSFNPGCDVKTIKCLGEVYKFKDVYILGAVNITDSTTPEEIYASAERQAFGMRYVDALIAEAKLITLPMPIENISDLVYAIIPYKDQWITELPDKQGFRIGLQPNAHRFADISVITKVIDEHFNAGNKKKNPPDQDSENDKYIVAWNINEIQQFITFLQPDNAGLSPKQQAYKQYNKLQEEFMEQRVSYYWNKILICKIIESTHEF